MIVLTICGVGLVAFALIYLCIDILIAKSQAHFINKSFNIPKAKATKNNIIFAGAVIGFAAGLFLTIGTQYIFIASMAFAGLGAGTVEATSRIIKRRKEEKRRQECFLLFNAIEIFIQGGYSIPQALANARDFTPLLKKDINKCLAAWPAGAVQALELLKESVNLPEGDQLISLLLQVQQSGAKNLSNIIQSEAKQMEEKRKALEKARISQKPIFMIVYRLLPLIVLMGMMAGVLITRVFNQMNNFI